MFRHTYTYTYIVVWTCNSRHAELIDFRFAANARGTQTHFFKKRRNSNADGEGGGFVHKTQQ